MDDFTKDGGAMIGELHRELIKQYRDHLSSVRSEYGLEPSSQPSDQASANSRVPGNFRREYYSPTEVVRSSLLERLPDLPTMLQDSTISRGTTSLGDPSLQWNNFQEHLGVYLQICKIYEVLTDVPNGLSRKMAFKGQLWRSFASKEERKSAKTALAQEKTSIMAETCKDLLEAFEDSKKTLTEILESWSVDNMVNPALDESVARGYRHLRALPSKKQLDIILDNCKSDQRQAGLETDTDFQNRFSRMGQIDELSKLALSYRNMNPELFGVHDLETQTPLDGDQSVSDDDWGEFDWFNPRSFGVYDLDTQSPQDGDQIAPESDLGKFDWGEVLMCGQN